VLLILPEFFKVSKGKQTELVSVAETGTSSGIFNSYPHFFYPNFGTVNNPKIMK
jgi:hypothetical protein